ncbi:hypothetical protein [Romboutsia sp. Marseille-P6047]|uniref:hypothetical protein n=1 Tax=Romboutsia sp. Marseille-P6047 TaxID=2161817 RepID=UPI000F05CDE5|nr:hypothetical protein [Romboutsia sp. Marseille-P6047]
MSKTNSDIKPFYIYTSNDKLYIKNINEHTEKLSNNIYTYCANIDSQKRIHICSIDTTGRLIHFFNNNRGYWKKTAICKAFNNTKNIKDMRLYIINNYLNLFVVEESSLDENIYKVSHFNFCPGNTKISKHDINNIVKDKGHIYKLNIDDLSNIVFEYKALNTSTRGESNNNTIIFNSQSRLWLTPNTLLRDINYTSNNQSKSNIRDDIFEYCYSIKYKK